MTALRSTELLWTDYGHFMLEFTCVSHTLDNVGYHFDTPNFTADERRAFRELHADQDIQILHADKGNARSSQCG